MQLPLLFSFRQPVLGNGFLAGVSMNGRALLEETNSEAWIAGVAPVGFSGGGADRGIAFAEFRNAWASVLFDIAAESETFEAFKVACTEFLSSTVQGLTIEWEAALQEVRRTKYVDPTLKREVVNGCPIEFQIVDLSHLQAKANELERGMKQAA